MAVVLVIIKYIIGSNQGNHREQAKNVTNPLHPELAKYTIPIPGILPGEKESIPSKK